MATTHLGGTPVHTAGDFPEPGSPVPAFSLVGTDLSTVDQSTFDGKRVVVNIFPSIDTPTCATSVRKFNAAASSLADTVVLNVSADLPFAQSRFCGAEGLENVKNASVFRSPEFGKDFGVTLTEGALEGLLARAVVVVDADGTILHSELVDDIGNEPNYDAALSALS